MANLHGIGKGFALYESQHDGNVPPDIAAFIRDQQRAKLFVCPSGRTALPDQRASEEELATTMNQLSDYIYIPLREPPEPVQDLGGLVLAFELPANHQQRQWNVLRRDLSVRKVQDMEELMDILHRTNTYLADARDPDK